VLSTRALAGFLGLSVMLLAAGNNKAAKARRPDSAQAPKAEEPQPPPEDRLGMTPAIACESIAGYEQYVPLAEAALTKDDKLLLYYRPLHYTIVQTGSKFQTHLVQDVRVRKRGDKKVVWSKEKLVDETNEKPEPPTLLCHFNKIALKGLTPGEYDLDIILHDLNSKGPPAEQTFRFKVKPSAPPPAPDAKAEGKTAEEPSARR
jgi:hypothetical protein